MDFTTILPQRLGKPPRTAQQEEAPTGQRPQAGGHAGHERSALHSQELVPVRLPVGSTAVVAGPPV